MTEGNRKVVIKQSDELQEMSGADEAYEIYETEAAEEEVVEEEQAREINSVEDLSDEELIWPNGPTAGMIKQWKQEFGDVYVTSITYDKHIAWRTLSRLEYKNLVRKMEQLMEAGQLSSAEANLWNEEAIAEICCLYPAYDRQSITSDLAGLPSLIAQEVLEASGFVALEVRQL